MKRFTITYAIIPACLILASCGLYSRYEQPNLTDVPQYDAYTTDGSSLLPSIASISLHDFFADEYLLALIDTALVRNTNVAVARLSVDQARASLGQARLAYLPSLSLSAQGGLTHSDGSTSTSYSVGPTASWELDIFGKLTNEKRMAAATLAEKEAYAQAVEARLVATVAETYYSLLLFDEQIAISRETLVLWEKTIDTMRKLSAAGRTNSVAVTQAEANRKGLEASLVTLLSGRETTVNVMSSLLRKPLETDMNRSTLESTSLSVSEIGIGVPAELLSARPDVVQAEAALSVAYYNENASRAAFYPSITITGSITYANPGKWIESAAAGLTQPLFNRGMLRANLLVAEAEREKALLEWEQTLFDAVMEVNDAVCDLDAARQRIRLDQQQVALLATAVAQTIEIVKHTSSTYLEVLSAQQSLLSAQLTLAQDREKELASLVTLYHALGGCN